MSDVALEPCPFCGDSDDYNPSISRSSKYAEPGNPGAGLIDSDFYVECAKCGSMGPMKLTEAEAVEAWNSRAALAALTKGGVE